MPSPAPVSGVTLSPIKGRPPSHTRRRFVLRSINGEVSDNPNARVPGAASGRGPLLGGRM